MTSYNFDLSRRLPRLHVTTRGTAKGTGKLLLATGMWALAVAMPGGAPKAAGNETWITTWAATPAPRWGEELPAPFNVPEVLGDQTVRQIARVSVGGDQLRVVISNEFGTRPVTIGSASVALSAGGGAIDPATAQPGTLGGKYPARLPPDD